MTDEVTKLIESITVFTQHDVSCSGGLTEWVSKSDFDRVVEELTKWHKVEDCSPNDGEAVICKIKYSFGKREVFRYEVSDFINGRYWCENNQYVKVLEWKRII